MTRVHRILAILALLAPWAGLAETATGSGPSGPLVAAVREAPPFAMRDDAGNWSGLSVDLWQDVADKLEVVFEWRELDLGATLDALERGEVDVAVPALTVTREREQRFDFAYPYLATGLALAVDGERSAGWLATLAAFFSREFLTAVGALIVVLMAAAAGVWIFERRANPEQFGGTPLRGLGEGFWWSAVTMTTVGYGDRAPVTLGGRVVALVWMFSSVIVIASFTASIAASVTVGRLESSFDARQLASARVGVLEDSRAASYGEAKGLRVRGHASLEEAAAALHAGEIDVMLHDAPILRHFARQHVEGEIQVLPGVIVRGDYAFAVPSRSRLRERINVALLSILPEPVWQGIQERYLGAENGG